MASEESTGEFEGDPERESEVPALAKKGYMQYYHTKRQMNDHRVKHSNKITLKNEKKLEDEKAFTDGAEALRLEWDRVPHNAKGKVVAKVKGKAASALALKDLPSGERKKPEDTEVSK